MLLKIDTIHTYLNKCAEAMAFFSKNYTVDGTSTKSQTLKILKV